MSYRLPSLTRPSRRSSVQIGLPQSVVINVAAEVPISIDMQDVNVQVRRRSQVPLTPQNPRTSISSPRGYMLQTDVQSAPPTAKHPHPPNKYSPIGAPTARDMSKRHSFPAYPSYSSPPQRPARSPRREKIYFYHAKDPHYGFTNFSAHPVVYNGETYPTSEHLFQSFKFLEHRPLLAEHIRTVSSRPSVALSEARRFRPEVRSDWMKVNVAKMDETLRLKFEQHPNLRQELLDTGDAELIEDSDKDSFWGIGADRKGRNELGKALERLRSQLRARPSRF